ncbi:MAG: sugar transferase [Candidatus Parcubacteria bacterium]|nr:MAG: sugar transferase [Candidatus Parcubacteria bacterium]
MKKALSLFKFFLIVLDSLLFFFSLFIVLFFRVKSIDRLIISINEHFIAFLFLLPIYLILIFAFSLYNFYLLNIKKIFIRTAYVLLVGLLASSLYFYFTQLFFGISPRTNLILFAIVFFWLLFFSRFLVIKFSYRGKLPLYFLGSETLRNKLKNDLKDNHFFEFKDLQDIEKIPPGSILVIDSNYRVNDDILLQKILSKNLSVFDYIDFYEKFFERIPLEAINVDWIVKEIFAGENKAYFYLKRIFDIVLAIFCLVFIFLPLLPFIAIAIYINSPGPIFFINSRVGYRGKVFNLIKFRTMTGVQRQESWAVGKEEKRIFFVGKILRKTHLDELPQLINILKGDISFVGPRPEQPQIVADMIKLIPFYDLRHLTMPGLTGWAQVNYKYPENVEETKIKLENDLYYLKNNNLFLDIIVIIKTLQNFIF